MTEVGRARVKVVEEDLGHQIALLVACGRVVFWTIDVRSRAMVIRSVAVPNPQLVTLRAVGD